MSNSDPPRSASIALSDERIKERLAEKLQAAHAVLYRDLPPMVVVNNYNPDRSAHFKVRFSDAPGADGVENQVAVLARHLCRERVRRMLDMRSMVLPHSPCIQQAAGTDRLAGISVRVTLERIDPLLGFVYVADAILVKDSVIFDD